MLSPAALRRWSRWSAITTALVAVLALVIAVWQIQAAQAIQREASAREAFKEYLKLAIDKPELADASLSAHSAGTQRSSYQWFVSYFLYSAEQIFAAYPNDAYWQRGLAEEICYHAVYLSAADYQSTGKQQHDPAFAAFVDQSLTQCPPDKGAH